ncbi:arginine--tRNA ligase [Capnocytophaga catalasegens]|uniref:Arginine--tRNA ligase n=1 Tax=Capnocytophaga catalasegens TaxID=1004260 RepID=A0AAV5AP28_9FLAO|nr:arginine--tRNA ligase [Capnocytophaga catalasegens]GIZ14095.1 arginine--tRNA ligase [Capnocytophaga catalasegens]GJM49093.1 arginine--tRNA ligase [Capnocytophaga catalasegens]GJM52354.1 arginine--tRNA ligase [Capnocytophaga catalasegens]
MQVIQDILTPVVQTAVNQLFGVKLDTVEFQQTRKEFEGDITLVIFPILRQIKGNPEQIGSQVGSFLQENSNEVVRYNVVKGFLNLVISNTYYTHFLKDILPQKDFGKTPQKPHSPAIIVEYSSPNTNKPLHLGHVRNNLLGYSVAKIIEASGKKVYKTQIINDRGIHICKSMLAWQRFSNGETPESTGLKGDKLVGNYYVIFDKKYKEEINQLISEGKTKEEAEKQAPIFLQAQEMLRKWEAGDPEVISLWKQMNQWVYDGFSVTYKNLGVDFDSYYYESNTYLLGKDIIDEGLQKGVFYRKEDGSVWCDLTADGLDEKLVLRSDGTSVYITQDIGTAIQRTKDYPDVKGMVYTVGNEQDYHFKVLFLILKKLGFDWAKNLYHLSYGMVELPNGKMKSREGTVVDADDLIQEVTFVAKEISQELGKLEGYSKVQKQELYRIIGLGALKYYILKYDPKKTIKFNPEESIDFQGNTAPFIQYAYARIRSILRKANAENQSFTFSTNIELHEKEKELIKLILQFPEVIQNAANNYSPALIANFVYDLVKEFNSFYQNVSILGEENTDIRNFRIELSRKVSEVIASGFDLLGIQVPERM